MSVKSVYLVIGGRVQGVGYRYFVVHKAEDLQITGWVRNTPEGKVEIEAEGEPSNLETFIDWVKIGPTRAIVQSFSISEITPLRNFKTFTIR
ncbi:MAG: acylphosphatase [Bacteroidota bacterium]|nr:acylphosphatase [Bacteroidota bacterium]